MNTILAGTPVVITAGRYFNECGVVALDSTTGIVEVLIGSPRHQGERVAVRRSSLELY